MWKKFNLYGRTRNFISLFIIQNNSKKLCLLLVDFLKDYSSSCHTIFYLALFAWCYIDPNIWGTSNPVRFLGGMFVICNELLFWIMHVFWDQGCGIQSVLQYQETGHRILSFGDQRHSGFGEEISMLWMSSTGQVLIDQCGKFQFQASGIQTWRQLTIEIAKG